MPACTFAAAPAASPCLNYACVYLRRRTRRIALPHRPPATCRRGVCGCAGIHPDKGGSAYLTTKINEAKDLLMKNKKGK